MDLSHIRLAIFDFDDTLAYHLNRNYMDMFTPENAPVFLAGTYTKPENYFDEIEPCKAPEELQKLVEEMRRQGAKLYCLSGMWTSLHLKAKGSFVWKHYGEDVEMVAARDQQTKVLVVNVLKRVYDLDYSEILFVDDMEQNIEMMKELGVTAIHLNDIVRQ